MHKPNYNAPKRTAFLKKPATKQQKTDGIIHTMNAKVIEHRSYAAAVIGKEQEVLRRFETRLLTQIKKEHPSIVTLEDVQRLQTFGRFAKPLRERASTKEEERVIEKYLTNVAWAVYTAIKFKH